eukprot:4265868-Pyramimonas_sp.AAC.1
MADMAPWPAAQGSCWHNLSANCSTCSGLKAAAIWSRSEVLMACQGMALGPWLGARLGAALPASLS